MGIRIADIKKSKESGLSWSKDGQTQAVKIGYVKMIRLSVYNQGSKSECVRILDGIVFGLWSRPFKIGTHSDFEP